MPSISGHPGSLMRVLARYTSLYHSCPNQEQVKVSARGREAEFSNSLVVSYDFAEKIEPLTFRIQQSLSKQAAEEDAKRTRCHCAMTPC